MEDGMGGYMVLEKMYEFMGMKAWGIGTCPNRTVACGQYFYL